MSACGSIPIVDLEPCLLGQRNAGWQRCADELCRAFREVGFVYLKNHGIPNQEVKEVFENASDFFQLPEVTKQKYLRRDGTYFGWMPLEGESTGRGLGDKDDSSYNPELPGDYKELFNVTMDPDLQAEQWPDAHVQDFQTTAMAFRERCQDLSRLVLRLMARGLGLENEEEFSQNHLFSADGNISTLRYAYYPALAPGQELKPGQTACGAHHDFGSITLLFQDDVGGLEVCTNSGEYVTATPIEGTVIVNIGDLMQRWTADQLKSTLHRVVSPRSVETLQRARQSVVFFCNPEAGALVRCVDGSDKYAPITGGDYLSMRFKTIVTE